jgi:predicted transcriptional regulator
VTDSDTPQDEPINLSPEEVEAIEKGLESMKAGRLVSVEEALDRARRVVEEWSASRRGA